MSSVVDPSFTREDLPSLHWIVHATSCGFLVLRPAELPPATYWVRGRMAPIRPEACRPATAPGFYVSYGSRPSWMSADTPLG